MDSVEGVEPAACLVHSFSDEIRCATEHIIHIRPVEIYFIVILLAHVGRIETFVPQGVRWHDPSLDSLVKLSAELGGGAYAYLFFPIFGTPNRQRSTPETAPAKVPVLDILEPLAETTGTGRLRLPVDGLVKSDHLVLDCGGLDEPGVQRVIKHGLVGTP